MIDLKLKGKVKLNNTATQVNSIRQQGKGKVMVFDQLAQTIRIFDDRLKQAEVTKKVPGDVERIVV
jgi:hypothetical protein